MTVRTTITFLDDEVGFTGYPFVPATVYPSGYVPHNAIKEVVVTGSPPEIRTVEDEVLFVERSRMDELIQCARRANIPIVGRVDVWSLILDPFVDTQFTEEEKARSDRQLEECGIRRKECEGLRNRVAPAMTAYNFDSGLWDWSHLGLYDLLCALSGILSGAAHKLEKRKMKRFYWKAMAIAARGKQTEWRITREPSRGKSGKKPGS